MRHTSTKSRACWGLKSRDNGGTVVSPHPSSTGNLRTGKLRAKHPLHWKSEGKVRFKGGVRGAKARLAKARLAKARLAKARLAKARLAKARLVPSRCVLGT